MPDAPSIQDALSWARSQLIDAESGSLDARLLLCHCLNQPQVYLLTWPDRQLDSQQWQRYQELVSKRQTGQPVAHLLGYRDFWTLRLQVSNKTLIPRPETELLVETALNLLDMNNARVLDLGTGTGAIALALASQQPYWQVTGVDYDADIVALAETNARLNQVSNARFVTSDWFSALAGQSFHLILSNPPYVEPDSPYLQQGDVRFEPLSALIADNHGLADLEKIIELAPQYLIDKGWLVLEHGYQQGSAVRKKLIQWGYTHVKSLTDLAGQERVSLGQYLQGNCNTQVT